MDGRGAGVWNKLLLEYCDRFTDIFSDFYQKAVFVFSSLPTDRRCTSGWQQLHHYNTKKATLANFSTLCNIRNKE